MRKSTGKHPLHTKRGNKKIPRNQLNKNTRRTRNKKHDPVGKDISIRQSDAPWRIVYGQTRIGGVYSQSHMDAGIGALHTVITLTGCLIDSIVTVYVGEDAITWGSDINTSGAWATGATKPDGSTVTYYTDKIFCHLNKGDVDQVADPHFVSQSNLLFPGVWTDEHRQRGCAHVYMIMIYDSKCFPEGLPEISFLVKGKPVYDPRIDDTVWSENAALIIADYLTDTRFGLGVGWDRIYLDRLSDAADRCDEVLTNIDGSTGIRFGCNFTFEVTDTKQDVLDKMVSSMAGVITTVEGGWKIWPAAWIAPTVDLTEADLRGPINIKTRQSRRDNFNAVRGTYVSPTNKYQVTDFPPVKNDYYKSLDNNETVWEDSPFATVTNPFQCQRLARIDLERIRQPIEVKAQFGLKAFSVEVPQTVTLTIDRYGWDAKEFEVMESELIIDQTNDAPELAVQLTLAETAEGIYNESGLETQVDLSPNSNLPNPFTAPEMLNLYLDSGTDQLYIRADGTIFTRLKVGWDAFDNYFISSNGYVEIQYKKSADADWSPVPLVPAELTFTHILDVQDGTEYDVRARNRNAVGISGSWTTIFTETIVGKSERPSDVQDFYGAANEFEIRFSWSAIFDLDVSHYELRQTDASLDWDSAYFIAEISGTQYVLRIAPTQVLYFLLKAIDTSGNYSENAAVLALNISVPTAVSITHTISGENVNVRWTVSTGQFAIEQYEIRYGDVYENSIFIAKIKSTALLFKAAWSGIRRFWVRAYDVAGNAGVLAYRDVQIYPPFAVSGLTAQIIDNNVLLRWTGSTGGTLAVDYYKIYKGNTLATAELIGNTSGTFSAIFEILAGNYVYWVVPVDIAGNEGMAASVGAVVDEPPDFQLLLDVILDPENADSLSNIRLELVSAPVETLPDVGLFGDVAPGTVIGGVCGPLTYAG